MVNEELVGLWFMFTQNQLYQVALFNVTLLNHREPPFYCGRDAGDNYTYKYGNLCYCVVSQQSFLHNI